MILSNFRSDTLILISKARTQSKRFYHKLAELRLQLFTIEDMKSVLNCIHIFSYLKNNDMLFYKINLWTQQ